MIHVIFFSHQACAHVSVPPLLRGERERAFSVSPFAAEKKLGVFLPQSMPRLEARAKRERNIAAKMALDLPG